jgi:protein phosphatase
MKGLDHDRNHDQFAILELARSARLDQSSLDEVGPGSVGGQAFVVADGVGGAPAPQRASRIAVESLVERLVQELPWDEVIRHDAERVTEVLGQLVRGTQAEVRRWARPGEHGMCTTLTMAFVAWPDLYLVHVGDSRCYLRHGGELRLLTHDHTLATLRGRPDGPGAHVLWNAVGGLESELRPEVLHAGLADGDALLLVTDGVLGLIGERRLEQVMAGRGSAAETCRELIPEAGVDDCTAVVVRFGRSRSAGPAEARAEEPEPRAGEAAITTG